jgi:hydroxymethylbilane synthase
MRVRALVATPDGRRIARADRSGDASRPELLGEQVAQALRDQGAVEILAQLASPE